MRYFYSLILILFMACSLPAQSYEVEWGEEFRREGGLFSTWHLAGLTDSSYHVIMQPRKRNTLLSFNLDHRLHKAQSIEFQDSRENLYLADFVKTQTETFAYFTKYDKRTSEFRLFVSPFFDGVFGDIKEIHQHEFRRNRSLVGFADNINADLLYAHMISEDRSKIGFSNVLSSIDQEEEKALSLVVFDENFDIIWEKIQVLEFDDEDLQVIQSIVSNAGELFLLAKHFSQPTFLQNAENRSYSYKVFRVSEEEYHVFDINLEGGLAPQYAGLYMAEGNPEAFYVGGFYTTNERGSGLQGVFLNEISLVNDLGHSMVNPLTDEFLEGLISNADERKNRGLDKSFIIKNFLQFEDGAFGFIAEKHYTTTHNTTSSPGHNPPPKTIYHTDELIIPRFNAAGELQNIQKIDKTFSSSSAAYTSYSLALTNGKVYLLYNDKKNAAERRELRKANIGGGYYTDMVVIDEVGKISYQETIFSNEDIDMNYIPSFSDYSAEHLLISTVRGKYLRCGLISLE